MGRELQKKKNRSSINKVRQKPKSKKVVNPRGNPIIAAKWDKSLTLAQNYKQLGLLSKLNARSGGTHKTTEEAKEAQKTSPAPRDPLGMTGPNEKNIVLTQAKVERDPETGAILRIVEPPGKKPNPLNDPLNFLSDDEDEFTGFADAKPPTAVVKELEEQAAMEIKPRPRQQSTREEEWIQRLVDKHGEDYKKMSRDMKLNPNQQTAADIVRRIKKWKARHSESA